MTEEQAQENVVEIRTILVPIDGSNVSIKALEYAIHISKKEKANLSCIHVIASPQYLSWESNEGKSILYAFYEEGKKRAEEWFRKATDLAAREGVKLTTEFVLDVRSVADTIVNYGINENVDLIVIGITGRTGLKKYLAGGIASAVILHAHCPVLAVR
ncbi:MAG: universal stress protein [Nitrososphaeraceae archaeon]|jgi:nucleotide-binding universal stress UspA family protein